MAPKDPSAPLRWPVSGDLDLGSAVLYVENGALKYRSPSGTVTVLAPA